MRNNPKYRLEKFVAFMTVPCQSYFYTWIGKVFADIKNKTKVL